MSAVGVRVGGLNGDAGMVVGVRMCKRGLRGAPIGARIGARIGTQMMGY